MINIAVTDKETDRIVRSLMRSARQDIEDKCYALARGTLDLASSLTQWYIDDDEKKELYLSHITLLHKVAVNSESDLT